MEKRVAEERRIAEEKRMDRISQLLAIAKANDSRTNGLTALSALEELLNLDPQHVEGLKLKAKISASLYPSANAAWENTLGMKFVPVPGTEVLFGVWDVRVQDYRAYARGNSGVDAAWEKPGFTQGEDHPVVNVSWNDAKAFCVWLTAKERSEGKLSASQSYRLPTDAEWSVAVGLNEAIGDPPEYKDRKIQDVYPWGTQWPPPSGAGNYDKSLGVDNYDNTSPVGSFPPNQFGLYDMGGNVLQWCEDWYSRTRKSRVLRGASWFNLISTYLLSSNRNINSADYRHDVVGFRCVLSDSSR